MEGEKCATPGCDNMALKHRRVCQSCKRARESQLHSGYRQQEKGDKRKKAESYYTRKETPQSVKDRLDREQRELDCRVLAKMTEPKDPGRTLTPEEIERIRHTITPIEQIPVQRHFSLSVIGF